MSMDLTQRELIETGDGSHSLYVPDLKEQYHSRHGAIQESLHVFIAMGLQARQEEELSILEIGFGTGLNAWLTGQHCGGKKINYFGIEAYPLSEEEAASLNYKDQIEGNESFFTWLHQSPWEVNSSSPYHSSFHLHKKKSRFQDFELDKSIDLIYFDAFAPDKQPELWTDDIFEKMFRLCAPGGNLVTYSAKGEVRRTMIRAGFQVEKLPGPPGKREMLRAVKPF